MNCISPPEPEDMLLMAFLDGEADQKLTLHLQQCPYCRERVASLARERNILTSRLYRVSCPSATELGEYHLRMLAPAQMLVISQHLRECPHCTREINQLKEFLSDLAPGLTDSLLGQTKLLIAQLVGERGGAGVGGETSFALRGEGKGPLTFDADGVVIVLDLQPAEDGKVNILGQVAADDQDQWTEARVELRHNNELQSSAIVDDLGAFRFDGIMAGLKELRISSKDGSLVVVSSFTV
jgi:hypothetical protein